MPHAKQSVALQRASNRQWVLKPQDLAVALKLVCLKGEWLPYAALAKAMHLSAFEVHAGIQRLIAARLVTAVEGRIRPVLATLKDFVLYGGPYAYPAVRGEITIGFATAYGVPPLKDQVLFSGESPPVWPHSTGTARGPSMLPLYPTMPLAAIADPDFYELLALFDALRIGQARERSMATKLIEARLQ